MKMADAAVVAGRDIHNYSVDDGEAHVYDNHT